MISKNTEQTQNLRAPSLKNSPTNYEVTTQQPVDQKADIAAGGLNQFLLLQKTGQNKKL